MRVVPPSRLPSSVASSAFLRADDRETLERERTPLYVAAAELDRGGRYGEQALYWLRGPWGDEERVLALEATDVRRRQVAELQPRSTLRRGRRPVPARPPADELRPRRLGAHRRRRAARARRRRARRRERPAAVGSGLHRPSGSCARLLDRFGGLPQCTGPGLPLEGARARSRGGSGPQLYRPSRADRKDNEVAGEELTPRPSHGVELDADSVLIPEHELELAVTVLTAPGGGWITPGEPIADDPQAEARHRVAAAARIARAATLAERREPRKTLGLLAMRRVRRRLVALRLPLRRLGRDFRPRARARTRGTRRARAPGRRSAAGDAGEPPLAARTRARGLA